MTLAEFRASGTDCPDLSVPIGADFYGDGPDPIVKPGRLYDGDCYIEKEADGRWYLILYRDEYLTTELRVLELRLYAWCIGETLSRKDFAEFQRKYPPLEVTLGERVVFTEHADGTFTVLDEATDTEWPGVSPEVAANTIWRCDGATEYKYVE
jgi:hypothetical protein